MANLFAFKSGLEDINSSINQVGAVSEANAIVSEELANEAIAAVNKDVQLLEDSTQVVENTAEMLDKESEIAEDLQHNGSVESYQERTLAIKNFISNQCGVLGISRKNFVTLPGIESSVKDPVMAYREACEGLKDFFTKIKDGVVNFFKKIWEGIKKFWKWITNSKEDSEPVDTSDATEEEIKEAYEESKGLAIKAVVGRVGVLSAVVLNEFFLHLVGALNDLLNKIKELFAKGKEAVGNFVKKCCGFIKRANTGNTSNGEQIAKLVETEVVEAEVVEPAEIENKVSTALKGLGRAHAELKKLGLTPSICGIEPDESNIKEIPALVDLGPSDPVVLNVYGDENHISSADFIFKTNDHKCPFVIWHNLTLNVDDAKFLKYLQGLLKESSLGDDATLNKLVKSLETQLSRLEKASDTVVKQLEYTKEDEVAASQVSSTAVSTVANSTKTITTMVQNSKQMKRFKKRVKGKKAKMNKSK